MKQHGDTVAGKKIEFIRKDAGGLAADVAKRLAAGTGGARQRRHPRRLRPHARTRSPRADVSAEAKKFMVVMNAATSIITTKSPYIARASVTLPHSRDARRLGGETRHQEAYTMVSDYGPGIDAETPSSSASRRPAARSSARSVPGRQPGFLRLRAARQGSQSGRDLHWIPGGAQPAAVGKALAERGIDTAKIKIMGQDELTDESALKSMGDIALGIITAGQLRLQPQSPMNQDFVKAYNDEFHRNPDFFAVGGYDGMHLIYEALKKTGGKADGDSLIAAAKGMAWESPRGPMSIDPETRDMIQNVYIRRVEKVGERLAQCRVRQGRERQGPGEGADEESDARPHRELSRKSWRRHAAHHSACCSTASPTACCCFCCRSGCR